MIEKAIAITYSIAALIAVIALIIYAKWLKRQQGGQAMNELALTFMISAYFFINYVTLTIRLSELEEKIDELKENKE